MSKKFAAVKIDETNFWARDIQRAAGKLFGIYTYDPSARTFCCEEIPSYYLEPVGASSENTLTDEHQAEMAEIFADTDPNYFFCRYVESLPHAWVELDDDSTLDDAREYFQSNSPVF